MSIFHRACTLSLTSLIVQISWAQPISAPDGAMAAVRPEVIRADMGFLADDLLEGRAPGTRGYAVGATYVASRYAALGLRPGGNDGSYFQDVPLRSMRLDESATSVSLRSRQGSERALQWRHDVLLFPDPGRESVAFEAPLVFVGYGITAPDQHHDDYAHLDVRGKVVIAMYGAPAFADPSVKAHYSAGQVKRQNAAAHGAAGFLALYSEDLQGRYPFDKMTEELEIPQMSWLDPAGTPNDYYPALKCDGFISVPGIARFLEQSGRSAESVYAAAKAGKLKGFSIPATIAIRSATRSTDIKSPNVIAILDGSDPDLKNEYVVYSAHLDHLGIGPPVNGDSIYNGALDNASGVAAVLSVAEAFSHSAKRPRRSILFVAVTGEEPGLLGSDYFARFPLVSAKSIVADLNMDGGVPMWPVADLNPYGAEHSSLAEPIRRAAETMQLRVSPDPHPEELLFIRSDQYSFVRQGVPSVLMSEGMQSSDPTVDTEKRLSEWEASTYHEPSDDMHQPNLDFDSAAVLVKFDFLVGWSVANESRRPQWNPGDFFGRMFGKADGE